VEDNFTPSEAQSAVENHPGDPWQLENLFRLSWQRTTSRFLSYFLVILLSFGFGLLAVGIVLVAFLLVGITAAFKIPALTVTLGILLGIIALLFFVYVGSWLQLAVVAVLIQEEPLGALETVRKVRPLVWGFVWLNLISAVFYLGLLPLGIVSLSVVLLLWAFWGSFSSLVYLRYRKKGLQNVWASRYLIRQRFWGILGRVAIVYTGAFVVSLGLSQIGSEGVSNLPSLLVNLLVTPFAISLKYEMFSLLTPPTEVKTPKVWLGLSILGWVLTIIVLVASFSALANLINNFNSLPKDWEKDLQKWGQETEALPTRSPYVPSTSGPYNFPSHLD